MIKFLERPFLTGHKKGNREGKANKPVPKREPLQVSIISSIAICAKDLTGHLLISSRGMLGKY